MTTVKTAAVLGASGYTGIELIRLIQNHPNIEIGVLTGHSRAGEEAASVFGSLSSFDLPKLQNWKDVDWTSVDVAFACLPHGASQETIAEIKPYVDTVVDLSADFRLRDPKLYEATYKRPHAFPDMLSQAVYGLSEWAEEALPSADLIACPGCFPTCSLLPLLPLLKDGLIKAEPLSISAITGVTGAGRKATLNLSYTELAEGAQAYGVGYHRHAPEIDYIIKNVTGLDTQVSMTPHLVPMNRGMIATTVVTLEKGKTYKDLRASMTAKYSKSVFVTVLNEGVVPQTRHVRGSNHCHINAFDNRVEGTATVIAVIDNLTKGSSGQALQNYNLSQKWDETLGLESIPVFP